MTRRLVVLGRKKAEYSTRYETWATREPLWHPQSASGPVIDADEIRKQQVEQDIADGVNT